MNSDRRTKSIESFKNSLRYSLGEAVLAAGPPTDDTLDGTFLCEAPLHELLVGPDEESIKMPKQLDLLVDFEVDGWHFCRHWFRLFFKRIRRDEWDNLLAVYEAVC